MGGGGGGGGGCYGHAALTSLDIENTGVGGSGRRLRLFGPFWKALGGVGHVDSSFRMIARRIRGGVHLPGLFSITYFISAFGDSCELICHSSLGCH